MIVEELQLALKNKYDSEFRDGIHVSDIVLCSRKAVFKKIEPCPITNRELNFFTSGRAIHEAIGTLAHNTGNYILEKEVEYQGIVGHVDLYDSRHNIPIECKSYRSKSIETPKPHHVEQLKSYMAILGSKKGIILYQLLLHFEDKPFVEFEVIMTDEEIKEKLQELTIAAALYKSAVETKSPMLLEGVMTDKTMNWMCDSCPYKAKCKAQIQEKAEEAKS